jgi:hypothetical protein
MATLKHIASKNSDYTAIEAYLIYQHDEFTGKQLLDEQGKPKLRESYLLDTLECGDFSFATACLLANRKYGKNTQHGDIKSHQYIISFDPRDAADNGLTMLQRVLKISRTGSCSSTALPSRKAVDGSAICLLEGQSSSGRAASVTSSRKNLCLPL